MLGTPIGNPRAPLSMSSHSPGVFDYTAMNRPKQTRLTRCRTGCMRCRVRRRKCDEGKPRCRNCIDRNFQCQYGPQLTFLAKNAHTVQALEVQTQSASYDAIQFVTEEASKDCDQTEDHTLDEISSHIDATLQQQQADPSTPSHARHEDAPFWPELTPHTANNENYRILNDKDESAVAGLLALGMNEPDLGLSPTRVVLKTPMISSNPLYQSPLTLQSIQPPPGSTLGTLSSTEIQGLLRHYRYKLACWVSFSKLPRAAQC
ncbi:hypothetical protein VN97_g709 [Penicillium thymicola]|uniref:Zn(2)-C6 fungal-type domain-containing protein n=1 Tax=Penicillium thymicola TaxID=293382 RepID=A0AAI9XE14_PENTH|nr:hypothetical protein VN97_g709 [Penicillium thymicola]